MAKDWEISLAAVSAEDIGAGAAYSLPRKQTSSVKAGVQKISLRSTCSMSKLWSKAMLPEPEKLQIKKAIREQIHTKAQGSLTC